MTYIPGISQSATAQLQSSQTAEEKNTLGQQDFLTLLVAQLQNQDPLNPSDPTEFTAQLAQFSELEQLFNLNDSMEQLATAQNNSERLSALSMIGKEILIEGASFQLDEGTAQIGYRVEGQVNNMEIFIRNSSGERVATLPADDFTEGNHFIPWNGLDTNGEHLPPGGYEMIINVQGSGEGEAVQVAPLVRSEVTGVDLSDSGAMLVTRTGNYSVTEIHGVYEQNETISAATDGTEMTSISERMSTIL